MMTTARLTPHDYPLPDARNVTIAPTEPLRLLADGLFDGGTRRDLRRRRFRSPGASGSDNELTMPFASAAAANSGQRFRMSAMRSGAPCRHPGISLSCAPRAGIHPAHRHPDSDGSHCSRHQFPSGLGGDAAELLGPTDRLVDGRSS